MPRTVLDEARIHPAIRERVAGHHAGTVQAAQQAVASHDVVVLGMGQNPFVKKARRALDAAGVAHHDIDHGSYFSAWRQRNALKMWSGWPTFPMVFVKGTLVGGAEDVQRLIDSGELKRLLLG
jgi:glutaredoxin-related protein